MIMLFYYVTINEIPRELSCHAKILYLLREKITLSVAT